MAARRRKARRLPAATGTITRLVRRPAKGRMARMWELPTREVAGEAGPGGSAPLRLWPGSFPLAGGARLAVGEELGEVSHGITRHRIRARVFAGEPGDPACAEGDADWRWALSP